MTSRTGYGDRMRTALVTGASSGIGAAFARRFAADGYALVIVARRTERLVALADELRAAGAPEVEILPADLATAPGREMVTTRLRSAPRPVDLLVNNAGIGLGKGLLAATAAEVRGQLELNTAAVLELTHAALPGMIGRGRGGVVNIASIAGLLPGRGSTYSASKAWVISFSEGMSMALAGTGVRMTVVCPGFVRTEFHSRAAIDMSGKPGWMYVPMATVVDSAMAALRANRPIVIPGALYRAIAIGAQLLPRSVVRALAYRIDRDRRD